MSQGFNDSNVKGTARSEGGCPETALERVATPEDKMIDEALDRAGEAIDNFICVALNLGCCVRCIDHDLEMVKSHAWKSFRDDAARGEAGPIHEDCGAHPHGGQS